jgi:hypothetical protein
MISTTGDFMLPGGLLDHRGVRHREGRLRPLAGRDEAWLHDVSPATRQAFLVTELLSRCVRTIGPHRATREMVRDLTVGDRDYLLLKLREVTFGAAISMVPSCPRPDCGAKMDLDLLVSDFPVEERPVGVSHRVSCDEPRPVTVEFRVPTGHEHEQVAALVGLDDEQLRDRLLASCILSIVDADGAAVGFESLAPSSKSQIADTIENASPRVETELELACPACAETFVLALDPASLLLEEIARHRTRFDREIHVLALHYHWSLRELLGLSRPRRQRYLRLLIAELEARQGRGAS